MTCPSDALFAVKGAARKGLLLNAGGREIEYLMPPRADAECLQVLRVFEEALNAWRPEVSAPNRPEADSLPVSDVQRRQLLTFRNGTRRDPYIASATRIIDAPLCAASALGAAAVLEVRHGALQYDIEEQDGIFRHIRRETPGIDVQAVDLSQVPQEHFPQALQDALSRIVTEGGNLGRGPHCRLVVAALSETCLLAALAVDHIFADLISVRILLNEFMHLYLAQLGGAVPDLPQAADYSAHLHSMNAAGSEQLKFWSLYLAGAAQPDFVNKRPEEPVSHDMHVSETWIGPASYARMKDLARQAKGTMFAVALARIFVLLRRMTGVEDITLGVIHANRDAANATAVALMADTVFVRAQGIATLDPAYVSYVWASVRAALRHARSPRSHITQCSGLVYPAVLVNFVPAPGRGPDPASAASGDASPALSARRIAAQVFRDEGGSMPQLLYIVLHDNGHDIRCRIYANPQYFDAKDYDVMHQVLRDA